jgi:hypothetical protein
MATNGWEYVGKKKGKSVNKTNKKKSNEPLDQIESEGLFSYKYLDDMTRHSLNHYFY